MTTSQSVFLKETAPDASQAALMRLTVRGGARLTGQVRLSGAKNSALKLLTASILTGDRVVICNYPSALADTRVHVGMLEALGKSCALTAPNRIEITELDGGLTDRLDWEGRSIRNTLLMLGCLTTRFGQAMVPLPGGCKLGERGFDIHEYVLRELGAELRQEGGMLVSEVPSGRLKGTDLHLRIRSTGATENAILCGTLAEGTTRVWNPHIRPEILDLIAMLRTMGAKISVRGQERIDIEGVDGLSGADHVTIADSMEAITWLIGAVMTDGDVEIIDFPYRDLEIPLIHLRESGAQFYTGEDSLIVRGGKCYPLEISTGPFPAINSDVQPILAAYALCAHGESGIVDLRFPGRYSYASEMAKMNGQFQTDGNLLRVKGRGRESLAGATVRALDLRAGIALALVGLAASGETIIEDAWQITRGYNDIIQKLRGLSADVRAEG